MKLIPAISVKKGRVAVVEDGMYSYPRNPDGQYRSPVNLLKQPNLSGEEVFIVDLGGMERNIPDFDMVKRIAAYRDVWLDAGITDADSMMDLFVSDATKVVMGTMFLDSMDELRRALDLTDNVIFSIAFDGKVVAADSGISGMTLEELLKQVGEIGLHEAMLFDLGSLRGNGAVDTFALKTLADRFEKVYVSGRIGGDDLKAIEDAGAAGAIIDYRTLEGIRDE